MNRLQEKVAVVTGGARGIGRAIVERFASEGASVMIADLEIDIAGDAAETIAQATGVRVLATRTDITDNNSILEMVERTRNELGPIDVLVNNAGIAVFRAPLEATDEDWRRCFAVDLEGAWLCARAVLPEMVERRAGAIVNIISNHAFTVIKETFPYPVAKHGLLGLTRSLGLEYADKGIAVNAISPGYTETPLVVAHFESADDPVAVRAEVESKQPVGRLCQPSEVAAVAAMLASDEARFIIGENIVIDGGVSIRMYE